MKYLGAITDDKDLVTKEYVDAHSGGGGSKNIWYATCPTAASTTAKVVTTSTADFTLTTGNMVRVLFTYANSASAPTLTVDGKTATAVRVVSGTSGAQYHWQAGEVADFVYNGTYFLMVSRATATTTYYGPTKLSSSTSSTSTTLAATASAVKSAYDLANGKQNALVVESAVTASASTSANTNRASTISLSKSGYTPIGIVGWDIESSSGANAGYANLMRCYLSAASSGSGTVTYVYRNMATSAMTATLTVYVLWQAN